jgi:serine protease Do
MGLMRFSSVFAVLRGRAECVAAALMLFGLTALPIDQAVARGAPDSFADLAGQWLPSVVNIATTQKIAANTADTNLPDLPPGSPLKDLFKDFLDKDKALPHHVTSLGTGFIVDASGLIVTNNHVIDGADAITVTLNDGTSLPATLVGRDDKTDLALIRVKPKAPLPAAHFGDSDRARIGDWVMAIGNPFGLGSSVTAGIVSARNRDIAAGPYDDFIQTDAPINRGNSGGPLFDMQGNVIGVTSAIFSPSGGSVGVGFAIPANMARHVVDQLRNGGQIKRGWMGVRIQEVTPDIAEGLGIPSSSGALVADVTANGPAAKAGVENGDVITGFDGKPVADSRALPRMVAETNIGQVTSIDVFRKGRKLILPVTIAKMEEEPALVASAAASQDLAVSKISPKLAGLGFALAPIDSGARSKYRLGIDVQGVVVTGVTPDSPAGEKDFRPGDVIVEIQNEHVSSPDDLSRQLDMQSKSGRKVVLLLVNREGNFTYVPLRLAEAG